MGKYIEIKSANFADVAVEQVTPQELVDISVIASPNDGGVVTGSGSYQSNTQVEISAVANDGYVFTGWNDGNTNATRTITVGTSSATYTASFVEGGILEWEQGTYGSNGVANPTNQKNIRTKKCKVSSSAQEVVYSAESLPKNSLIGICLWKADGTWIERILEIQSLTAPQDKSISVNISTLEIEEVSLVFGYTEGQISPSDISSIISSYNLEVTGLKKTIQ